MSVRQNSARSASHARLAFRFVLGSLRIARQRFRRWWRGKKSLDFLYWRLLRRRRFAATRSFAMKSLRLSTLEEIRNVASRFLPSQIYEPLIRIGSDSDGGYLLTQEASQISALFSPGVGLEAGFEEFFARKGIDCFLADASVMGPPMAHEKIHFLRKHLGMQDDDLTISLSSWISGCVGPTQTELGLQMDIEGGEYEVLSGFDRKNLSRFRFLVIEFHELNKLVDHGFLSCVDKILDEVLASHLIVHTHANNATPPIRWSLLRIFPTLEIVAIRSDLVSPTGKIANLPNPLDRKNLGHRRDWPFRAH